jgi:NADH-quinone oxidoreductase subunit A
LVQSSSLCVASPLGKELKEEDQMLHLIIDTQNLNLFFGIIVFFFFCIVISLVLALLTVFFSFDPMGQSLELVTIYECGFLPFVLQRLRFDVSFYIIGVLFIIFDLEIIFLFPWISSFFVVGGLGFVGVLAFFFILWVGLYVEFKLDVLSL